MNNLEKIISLSSEIEIGEKDADIVCSVDEADYYYDKYLPQLYKEINLAYEKLIKELNNTNKHSQYKFQLELLND